MECNSSTTSFPLNEKKKKKEVIPKCENDSPTAIQEGSRSEQTFPLWKQWRKFLPKHIEVPVNSERPLLVSAHGFAILKVAQTSDFDVGHWHSTSAFFFSFFHFYPCSAQVKSSKQTDLVFYCFSNISERRCYINSCKLRRYPCHSARPMLDLPTGAQVATVAAFFLISSTKAVKAMVYWFWPFCVCCFQQNLVPWEHQWRYGFRKDQVCHFELYYLSTQEKLQSWARHLTWAEVQTQRSIGRKPHPTKTLNCRGGIRNTWAVLSQQEILALHEAKGSFLHLHGAQRFRPVLECYRVPPPLATCTIV